MNICHGIVTMVTASTAVAPPAPSPPSAVHHPFPIPPSALKKQGMVREGERERWQDWTNKMH